MIFEIPYLEFLITHKCNMHCDGCANYANYAMKRSMDFEENKEYIRIWSRRLSPKLLRILGGEPTISDDLIDYIRLMHSLWPSAERQLVTNGAFIHRHGNLEETLRETGTSVHLSFHSNEPEYLESVRPAISLMKAWRGVTVTWGDYRVFSRLYRGMGRTMLPYEDGDPRRSWDSCQAKGCKTISRGRLWKCPPIMGLRTALERFGIEKSSAWQRYITYDGIGSDASDDELQRFLSAGPEWICGMCPKAPVSFRKDVFNTNWDRNSDRVESDAADIDIGRFIQSV